MPLKYAITNFCHQMPFTGESLNSLQDADPCNPQCLLRQAGKQDPRPREGQVRTEQLGARELGKRFGVLFLQFVHVPRCWAEALKEQRASPSTRQDGSQMCRQNWPRAFAGAEPRELISAVTCARSSPCPLPPQRWGRGRGGEEPCAPGREKADQAEDASPL